jgi:Bardet-Biedl syndrome 7 protein
VTGDDSGSVGCYEFKKGAPQTVFLSQPFDGPISCVAIGGNPQKKDKVFIVSCIYDSLNCSCIVRLPKDCPTTMQIFVAHSQRIIGLTKKGKEFFKLTSSLTESIRNIAVEETKIWTGCEYIYNLYDNGQDVALYMCRDLINALAVEHISRETDHDVILACQDNCLRIVQGSSLIAEIPTTAPATAIACKGDPFLYQIIRLSYF